MASKRVWDSGDFPDLEPLLDRWLNANVRAAIREYVLGSKIFPEIGKPWNIEYCLILDDDTVLQKFVSIKNFVKSAIDMAEKEKLITLKKELEKAIKQIDKSLKE